MRRAGTDRRAREGQPSGSRLGASPRPGRPRGRRTSSSSPLLPRRPRCRAPAFELLQRAQEGAEDARLCARRARGRMRRRAPERSVRFHRSSPEWRWLKRASSRTKPSKRLFERARSRRTVKSRAEAPVAHRKRARWARSPFAITAFVMTSRFILDPPLDPPLQGEGGPSEARVGWGRVERNDSPPPPPPPLEGEGRWSGDAVAHRLALLVLAQELRRRDAPPERLALARERLDRVEVRLQGEALPRTRSGIAAIGSRKPLRDRFACALRERDHRLPGRGAAHRARAANLPPRPPRDRRSPRRGGARRRSRGNAPRLRAGWGAGAARGADAGRACR